MFALVALLLLALAWVARTKFELGDARESHRKLAAEYCALSEYSIRRRDEDAKLVDSARAERDNAWGRLELIAAVMIRRPPRRRWLAIARKVARVSCGYLRLGPLTPAARMETLEHFSRVSEDPFFYVRSPAIVVTPGLRTKEEEEARRREARPTRSLHMDVLNAHARDV